jgi:transposase
MNKGGGKNNFKLTPNQIQEAILLFDTLKLHALAARYNVSHVTMSRTLRRAGLIRPKKRVADKIRLTPSQLQIALDMHQEKKTLDQISERIDMCKIIIVRELKAAGKYNSGRWPPSVKPKTKNHAGEYEPHWNKDLSVHFLRRPLRAVST